jgi:hypothetical protein
VKRPAVVTIVVSVALAGCGGNGAQRPREIGRQVNVSNALGLQAEVSAAVDPRDPRVLLAGANDEGRMLGSESADGGLRWRERSPGIPQGKCASDPAVGIDRGGRRYYAFLVLDSCDERASRSFLYVATERRRHGWRVPRQPIDPRAHGTSDDRPALAVDVGPQSPDRGSVYVAWTRFEAREEKGAELLFSASRDHGRHWSTPALVSSESQAPSDASLAVAADGAVYLTWFDTALSRVELARSRDGGRTFDLTHFVAQPVIAASDTCYPYGTPIPAQPKRCIAPVPVVTVDTSSGRFRGRVYVTFSGAGANGTQDVYLAAFDPSLQPLFGNPHERSFFPQVNPPDRGGGADQFLPVSALDASDGTLWVCFYDSGTDGQRSLAWFRCTASRDGGKTWTRLLAAASGPSDQSGGGADPFEYGDYEALAVADGVAHPFWTDTRNKGDKGEIYTTRLVAVKASRRLSLRAPSAEGRKGFVARGNAICTAYYEKLARIPGPPKGRAVDAERRTLRALDQTIRQLGRLAPPAGDESRFRHALALTRRIRGVSHRLVAALGRGDVRAAHRLEQKGNALDARVNTVFAQLGLFVCAQPGTSNNGG